jgi:uncharacterized protein (TIGR02271 family)
MSYEGTAGGTRTITAFFDSRTDADEAVEALVNAGISRSQVRVVAGREGGMSGSSSSSYSSSSSSSYSSSNEGGFWDSLKDLFLPDEDRHTYAEGLNRGGYLVTATVSDAHYETALDILDDEGTIDMNERESSWRSEGWSGYSGASTTSGLTGMARGGSLESGGLATGSGGTTSGSSGLDIGSGGMAAGSTSLGTSGSVGNEEVIPVAEEELRIGKRDVSHGRVRVRSYVVETPVSEQVSLREENVHIERRPADRAISGNEQLFQDRTIDLEERAEEAVVSKDARIREELVISKDVNQRTETVSDTVRRTEVEVDDERVGGTGTGSGLGSTVDRTR